MDAVHAPSASAALRLFEASAFDAVITDLRMPDMDGMALLRELHARAPEVPVVMLTAHGTVPIAVEAMRAGAADFMMKPFDRDEVLYTLDKVLAAGATSKPPPAPASADVSLGASAAMREVEELVKRAARTTSTVLLRGESGTGKEVVARLIHATSARAAGPFVAVNCAALPEQLLESELFGYEKGAFTGAAARKPGRVDLATGGTLFLDEIGDVPAQMQAKLLRLLQEKEYQRLGGTRTEKADVRFVAATHRDLEAMIEAGTFREDLYYRLAVVPIWLAPLRERSEDLGLLAERFAERFARENGRGPLAIAPGAHQALAAHTWPGNVRELMSVVERLVVFTDNARIEASDVEREIARQMPRGRRPPPPAPTLQPAPPIDDEEDDDDEVEVAGEPKLSARVEEAERRAILDALARSHDNRSQAARLLGISRRTLYKRLASLKIP
ncbi:MAG: sigma-54 dependent transcriptional regulator [Polyangiaceae bacterium]